MQRDQPKNQICKFKATSIFPSKPPCFNKLIAAAWRVPHSGSLASSGTALAHRDAISVRIHETITLASESRKAVLGSSRFWRNALPELIEFAGVEERHCLRNLPRRHRKVPGVGVVIRHAIVGCR